MSFGQSDQLKDAKSLDKRSPVFGMKPTLLNADELGNANDIGGQLVEVYQIELLRATIIAAGSEVIDIPDVKDHKAMTGVNKNYFFVRDPVVILPDKKLMLFTNGNRAYGVKAVLNLGERLMGYAASELQDAYMEGGNVLYCSKRNILLHGINPSGHYLGKPTPKETTQKLAEKLAPFGTVVVGLELNAELLSDMGWHYQRNIYYHLDCFIQILPDGRILILNKNILSEESQKKMQALFGNDFIDLAYPDYLSETVLFNFIVVQQNQVINVIAPPLPEFVLSALGKQNLRVITAKMLDENEKSYDKALSEQVATLLRQKGYETATANNLTTHIPKNKHGYSANDGTTLPTKNRRCLAISFY